MSQNKYSHFKQLEHVTGNDSSLGKLLLRANGVLAHQQSVLSFLEPSCRAHCWLANFRNGTLYLQSDSSAWGTRIRMQQRSLIQQLKNVPPFQNIKAVRVSIQPRYKVEKPQRAAKPISAENARQLQETANMTEDAGLSAALAHLAATARSNKSGREGS